MQPDIYGRTVKLQNGTYIVTDNKGNTIKIEDDGRSIDAVYNSINAMSPNPATVFMAPV